MGLHVCQDSLCDRMKPLLAIVREAYPFPWFIPHVPVSISDQNEAQHLLTLPGLDFKQEPELLQAGRCAIPHNTKSSAYASLVSYEAWGGIKKAIGTAAHYHRLLPPSTGTCRPETCHQIFKPTVSMQFCFLVRGASSVDRLVGRRQLTGRWAALAFGCYCPPSLIGQLRSAKLLGSAADYAPEIDLSLVADGSIAVLVILLAAAVPFTPNPRSLSGEDG
ncbi:hypothetical protein F4780DRAFT_644091 [Xylariomycetidae sp. FL0641]|nr:hypothetical protein F4780DRAFT_644091 [Xylariomycetidae sp. FL0641]